jgi:hypothetical protein
LHVLPAAHSGGLYREIEPCTRSTGDGRDEESRESLPRQRALDLSDYANRRLATSLSRSTLGLRETEQSGAPLTALDHGENAQSEYHTSA